jgi:hypothetical protein
MYPAHARLCAPDLSETGVTAEMADLPKARKPEISQGEVAKSVPNGDSAECNKNPAASEAAAAHQTDFDPPIYNVWKQQTVADFSGNGERPGA